jgi:hypothetical protein
MWVDKGKNVEMEEEGEGAYITPPHLYRGKRRLGTNVFFILFQIN